MMPRPIGSARVDLLDEEIECDEVIAEESARHAADELENLSQQRDLPFLRIGLSAGIVDVHVDGVDDVFDQLITIVEVLHRTRLARCFDDIEQIDA